MTSSDQPAHRPARILVASDSTLEQQEIKLILERAGHLVSLANDGYGAIDRIADETFDVVVTALEMAPTDGFQLLVWVLQMPPDPPPPKLICFSVNMPRKDLLARMGVPLLARPIDHEALLQAIAHRLAEPHEPRPSSHGAH
jgi:CheY-like chemotaxis protein